MYYPRQRGSRGEERLLAERLATAVEPLAGFKPLLSEEPPQAPPAPREVAAWAAALVLEDRRSLQPGRGLGRLLAWAASNTPLDAASRLLGGPLAALVVDAARRRGSGGLRGLMAAAARHASKPGAASLVELAAAAAVEAGRPCAVDPVLEGERRRLEARMRLLGAILGATLPALFILSFYVHPVAGLAAVAAAAAVWAAVLSVGRRFRASVIEAAWAACRLRTDELVDIAFGRDLPPLYDMLGGGRGGARGSRTADTPRRRALQRGF